AVAAQTRNPQIGDRHRSSGHDHRPARALFQCARAGQTATRTGAGQETPRQARGCGQTRLAAAESPAASGQGLMAQVLIDSSDEMLRSVEWAAVRAWPAPASADIDGWLWRYASGGSLRANSVATLIFPGRDVERAIHTAEARYRMNGVPSRFTITAVSAPADLDGRLAARGYDRGDEHATMLKVLSRGARPSAEE